MTNEWGQTNGEQKFARPHSFVPIRLSFLVMVMLGGQFCGSRNLVEVSGRVAQKEGGNPQLKTQHDSCLRRWIAGRSSRP